MIWPFSVYYDRTDDIPHANINALLVALAYRENIVITLADIKMIANVYEGLLYSNGDIGPTLIDGTDSLSFSLGNSALYFQPLACYSPTLKPKVAQVINYHGMNYRDILTLSTWLHLCR